jgi:hypothetical protein
LIVKIFGRKGKKEKEKEIKRKNIKEMRKFPLQLHPKKSAHVGHCEGGLGCKLKIKFILINIGEHLPELDLRLQVYTIFFLVEENAKRKK